MADPSEFLNEDGTGLNPVLMEDYQDTYVRQTADSTVIGYREAERMLNPVQAAVTGRPETFTEITPVTATGFYQSFSEMPDNERNGIILGLAAEGYFGMVESVEQMQEYMEDPARIAAALKAAVDTAALTVSTGVVTDESMVPGMGKEYSIDDLDMLVEEYIVPGKKYPPPSSIKRTLNTVSEGKINKRMSSSEHATFYSGVKAAIDSGEYSSVDVLGMAEEFVAETDPVRTRAGEFGDAVGVLQNAITQKRIAGSVVAGVTR